MAIPMSKAIEMCGDRPEWGAYVCIDLGGNSFWVNSEFTIIEGSSIIVAASWGNNHPRYFNVEGLPPYEFASSSKTLHICDKCTTEE